MRLGTIAVRDALGQGVPGITDKDIQEALWHYYYDLDKSANYLLSKAMPKEEKMKKMKGGSLFPPFVTHVYMGRCAGVARREPKAGHAGLGRCVTSSNGALLYCGC